MIITEARWSTPGRRAFNLESDSEDITLADLMRLSQEYNVKPEDIRLSADCKYPDTDDPGYFIEASWTPR